MSSPTFKIILNLVFYVNANVHKYLEHPTFYLPKSLFKQISSIVNGLLQPNLTTSRPHNQPVSCQVKDQKKNSVKQKCVYPPFNCILEVWLTDCAII